MATQNALKTIEILLVEDNAADRLLAVDALEQSGLLNTLNFAKDGVEAMRYLRREGEFEAAKRPDLVLLDLNLPKKDGREVLAEIKADPSLKYIPVIVLTTSRSDSDLLEAYGHHANGYITKPLDFVSFSEALRTLGGYWFNIVTLPPGPSVDRLRPESETRPWTERRQEDNVRAVLVSESSARSNQLRALLAESSAFKFHFAQVRTLGDAALLLRQNAVDLLMLDLAVTETPASVSPATLCQQARRLVGAVPTLALVAENDEAAGARALSDGADDYLALDDVNLKSLLRATRHALDKKHYRQQLRHGHRLEAVGRLVAGVAHDFNNLLSIVKGSTEILLGKDPDAASRAELLQTVGDATERASVLTRQLLTLSHERPMDHQRVDLNQVVGSFVRLLRRLTGNNIRLEVELAHLPLPIVADPGMLDQVLLNLALNARDAMPDGGVLRITTRAITLDASTGGEQSTTPKGSRAYPGSFAALSVSDNGVGMPPDVLARAFEPFFTTKARTGTGLGLATVDNIIEQHQGWLEVHSQVGIGTRFDIFLPSTASGARGLAS